MPVVGKPLAGQEADWPVVVFSGDGIVERPPLCVALHTDVIAAYKVQGFRINDVRLCRMLNVQASGAMALFAAHVPFRDLMGLDVVVDGVASVAGGSGGAVKVGGSVEGLPPVGAGLHV